MPIYFKNLRLKSTISKHKIPTHPFSMNKKDKEVCSSFVNDKLSNPEMDTKKLEETFGIPNLIRFEFGFGKLFKVTITHPNSSYLEIQLFGAIITRWITSDGKERIGTYDLNENKRKKKSKNGLSLSFPQYGRALQSVNESIPRDGFASEMLWEIVSTNISDMHKDRKPSVTIRIKDTDKSRAVWPNEFELSYKISLSSNLSYHDTRTTTTKNQQTKKIMNYLTNYEEGFKLTSYLCKINTSDFTKNAKNLIKNGESRSIEKDNKTTITQVTHNESKPIENMIARRRRIEKEKGQPGYFKYNIASEKAIDVISTFAAKGYPEDLHLNYTILNCGRLPLECTTGLLTHFVKLDSKKEHALSLGLGLLPFLDISNPCIPEVGSESNHSISYHESALDRWYVETMTPNQVYFCPGDSTHIRVIQIEGLNNVHVWYPKGLSKKNNWRKSICYSPCRAITPIEIAPGENWRAKTTLRWFPYQLPDAYWSIDSIVGRPDILGSPKNSSF